jgi:DNA-binding CsgD family transcriptional regulator
MELLEERFADWGLTPAERDVALFAIKGMSTAEIASLRSTSEGTVKAQTNAIYRKAGVTGRPQLLSLFIEDLMDGSPINAPAPDLEAEPLKSRKVG